MKCLVSIVIALMLLMPAQRSLAVAFCALRDPILYIKELYPSYTGYYSSVADIDLIKARIALNHYEVPFGLHPKEIGKHTVYFIEDETGQIGIIHTRSEFGKWGVIEITWSLSMDGAIQDYRFQRCRDPACRGADSDEVRALFKGLSIENFRKLFDDSGIAAPTVSGLSPHIFQTMVKSAAKTLILTESFWDPANR